MDLGDDSLQCKEDDDSLSSNDYEATNVPILNLPTRSKMMNYSQNKKQLKE